MCTCNLVEGRRYTLGTARRARCKLIIIQEVHEILENFSEEQSLSFFCVLEDYTEPHLNPYKWREILERMAFSTSQDIFL